MIRDPRQRFTDRVGDYVSYRPGYPDALIDAVTDLVGDRSAPVVADIGAGTGIFTRALVARGLQVYAVEPNAAMRAAASQDLADTASFTAVDGSAEATGLEPGSIDLITAAQAFHWFDRAAARAEFERILSPGGRVALIWNRRRLTEPFQRAYDDILREYAPEYDRINHMKLGREAIEKFLHPGRVECRRFDNHQHLDYDGLIGRLHSSSYCPPMDSDNYAAMLGELDELFARYQRDGHITFTYDSELFAGGFER